MNAVALFPQFDTQRRKCMRFSTMNSFMLNKLKCRPTWWTLNMPQHAQLKAVREDTRYWRTLTEKASLASQITASVEDDTHVIDCRSVNDDAASKFIEMPVATW